MKTAPDARNRRRVHRPLAWFAALLLFALSAVACQRSCPPEVPTGPDVPSPLFVTGLDGSRVDVEHHDGNFNGLTIHYVTAGPAFGKKVLLLHGFPELWYGWRYQIAALAKGGYRVYAPICGGSIAPRSPRTRRTTRSPKSPPTWWS